MNNKLIIDSRFRIPIAGKYSSGIWFCSNCGHDHRMVDMAVHTVGFAETINGTFQIVECVSCFEKFYFHAGVSSYDLFELRVDQGKSKFFESLKPPNIPRLKTPKGLSR